jgi:hypothetical protein
MFKKLLCGLLILCCYPCRPQDTIPCKKKGRLPPGVTYQNNLSVSYICYSNWKYNGYNSFSFLARSAVYYDSASQKQELHLRFNGELSYMKFQDSTWLKGNDLLDLSAEFIRKTSKRLSTALTFNFNSQFLSDYEPYFNEWGEASERWTGGFGNPMALDLCYGSTLRFWKTCRITASYATLKTTVEPLSKNPAAAGPNELVLDHAIIRSNYGFNLQSSIRHRFAKHLSWENHSRIFVNALSASHLDLDLRNKIIINLVKHLDIIVDTKLRYLPKPPYQLQMRNELMLSFSLEKL